MLSFDSWAQGHVKNRRSNGLVDRMSTAARIILLHQPTLLRLALLTWSDLSLATICLLLFAIVPFAATPEVREFEPGLA
jgi:hypothetical protein